MNESVSNSMKRAIDTKLALEYLRDSGSGQTSRSDTTVQCRSRDPWRQHKARLPAATPPATSLSLTNRKERRQAASKARSLARDIKRQEKHLKHLKNKEVDELEKKLAELDK
jgi:hypothetical protein